MTRHDDIDQAIEEVLAEDETEIGARDVIAEIDLEAKLEEAVDLLRRVASARGWVELEAAQRMVRTFLEELA